MSPAVDPEVVPKRHLVIGASGQLGSAIYSVAVERGLQCLGTTCRHITEGLTRLDVTRHVEIVRLMQEYRPEVVYYLPALSDIDACEKQREKSYKTTVTGCRHVIDAANRQGARIVFISCDQIFDGKAGPYTERDAANPLSVYGAHKLIAEHLVATTAIDYLIVRTAEIYGWSEMGKNFVCEIIQKLGQDRHVKVADDQLTTPTYSLDFAQALIDLVNVSGADPTLSCDVYHVAGPDHVSRYKFAREIASVFGLNHELLEPVTSSQAHKKAQRPLNGGLVCSRFSRVVKRNLPGLGSGLRKMLKDEL